MHSCYVLVWFIQHEFKRPSDRYYQHGIHCVLRMCYMVAYYQPCDSWFLKNGMKPIETT